MTSNERRILYLRDMGKTLGQISRDTHMAVSEVIDTLKVARHKSHDCVLRSLVMEQAILDMGVDLGVPDAQVGEYVRSSIAWLKKNGDLPTGWRLQ